jgi:hypothetical protein
MEAPKDWNEGFKSGVNPLKQADAHWNERRKKANGSAEGAEVLNAIHAYLGRFVSYPDENAHVAHTLWIAHTHLMDAWESTPRIAFLSPEPASGKTRALEASEPLVPRPIEAISVTPAYLFRKVGDPDGMPTILYDEIDTVFGAKVRKDNEEIRALLNAGHRRGATAGRCVMRGKIIETEEIPAYCAVALAGLGDLPDTILSRSVIIHMRRRAPGEHVEPFRRRVNAPEGHELRERLAAWAARKLKQAAAARPHIPDMIEDRNADIWEPLLAVGDLAGGEWPERARVAAVALVALTMASRPSLGIRLLADLKTAFDQDDADALPTSVILQRLKDLNESPWTDLYGKPLDDRGLAKRLKPYGINPKGIRWGDSTLRGYVRESLTDAWLRYLSPPPYATATSATTATDAPSNS